MIRVWGDKIGYSDFFLLVSCTDGWFRDVSCHLGVTNRNEYLVRCWEF